jgi:hypothetical protein
MRKRAMRDSSGNLEQVHVRGINRRSLRLELVAGLGIALALPALSASAQSAATSTSIAVQTGQSTTQSNPSGTCSLITATVSVTSSQGVPAGTVTIEDEASGSPVSLGSQTLNSSGQASFSLALADGGHTLIAAYSGSAAYLGSTSVSVSSAVSSQCLASFVVNVSSLSPSSTFTAGQAGTATVTVTPLPSFLASLGSSPAFITLSCSGLPDWSSCTFSPEEVEILPNQNEGMTASMTLQTQEGGTARLTRPGSPHTRGSAPIAWALLLPGALGLGGLAWGARRRAWLSRMALVALVGLVTMLGTTACNPRYYYFHHGPTINLPTPSGSYTLLVTGQSSNGITAITQNTYLAFTVQ